MPSLEIRFMTKNDFAEILEIENQSFAFPWRESHLRENLNDRNVIGLVATLANKIVAYTVFEVYKTKLNIRNLAVSPSCRRMKIGKSLLTHLHEKVGDGGICCLYVRDSNLGAQLFLRQEGYKAVAVIRDYFQNYVNDFDEPDHIEDAYKLVFERND